MYNLIRSAILTGGYIMKDTIIQGGSECLKIKMFEISDEDRIANMIHFKNRVLLHQCSSYLLKKKKTKENMSLDECRLNYVSYKKK